MKINAFRFQPIAIMIMFFYVGCALLCCFPSDCYIPLPHDHCCISTVGSLPASTSV